MSGLVDEYLQPLCPLHIDGHEHRYLAIDSSEERFNDFTRTFADPASSMDKGHLVVVTGDRGYGKTSLIQRCAFWLREQAKSHCKVVVADFSDERWPSTDTEEERLRRTFDWIMDELRDTLERDEVTQIRGYADMMESYRDLGRVLRDRVGSNGDAAPPVLLIVLLQGYPRPPELEQYYMLARPGMLFFAELFESEDMAKMAEMMPRFNKHGTDVHLLAMDELKSGDADLLVDWIRQYGGNWPDVPREIVRKYFDFIIRYKVGMSQLSKLTWGTLAVAAAESASSVSDEHVARYYALDRYEKTV